MLVRYAYAVVAAGAMTFGLFFLMQWLIARGLDDPLEDKKSQVIEFVRLKKDSETQTKQRRLPPKAPPKKPPPPPDLDMAKAPKPRVRAMNVSGPNLRGSVALAGGPDLGAPPSDMDVVPLVRIPPQYPPRAQTRGIEGWVLLEFSISKTGTVENVTVVDASPPSIFNRAARRAVSRWKYKPKIAEGLPVERFGVQTLLSFNLEDD